MHREHTYWRHVCLFGCCFSKDISVKCTTSPEQDLLNVLIEKTNGCGKFLEQQVFVRTCKVNRRVHLWIWKEDAAEKLHLEQDLARRAEKDAQEMDSLPRVFRMLPSMLSINFTTKRGKMSILRSHTTPIVFKVLCRRTFTSCVSVRPHWKKDICSRKQHNNSK